MTCFSGVCFLLHKRFGKDEEKLKFSMTSSVKNVLVDVGLTLLSWLKTEF